LRLVVSSFYFKIVIATLNSVYLKLLLLSVLFYRLNVYIYICFIMSKKKVIPRAYTVSSLNLTREIYIYIICMYVCMCVLYKLHLTKKLKKGKYCFHDILIRTKNLGFSSRTSKNKKTNIKIWWKKNWTISLLISTTLNKYSAYWYKCQLLWCT